MLFATVACPKDQRVPHDNVQIHTVEESKRGTRINAEYVGDFLFPVGESVTVSYQMHKKGKSNSVLCYVHRKIYHGDDETTNIVFRSKPNKTD